MKRLTPTTITTRRVLLACLLLNLIGAGGFAATDEVRGTWLTTTGVDHIRGGLNTEQVLGDLTDIGFNTVYVETWKNGYTNYPSAVLADFTGGPDRSPFLGSSRDLVEETVIHAHRQGLNYLGWFEYGLAAQFVGSGGFPSNPLATKMRNNGWLLQDQSGRYGNPSNGFAWMNPAVPEVREFLIDIVIEAIDRYDFDGVQLDDRLAWPREFGWDATTEALYADETGRSLPTSTGDAHFREWRQSKVTLLAEELSAAVRTRRPTLQLSVSPSITNFSDVQYNAQWPDWQNSQLFDEYAIQVYRDNIGSFNQAIGGQVAQFGPNELVELVVGLRGGTASPGSETPYADLQAMIERTRDENAAGHSIFFSYTVRDIYGEELEAFYNVDGDGPAANPLFGADWRPAPIVGEAAAGGANTWVFDVTQASRYKVVAKQGAYWREVGRLPVTAGELQLQVSGASQVELLLDRRPLSLADYNGDGAVNAADYTVWRNTLGSTIDLRADYDGDSVVGLSDYQAWRSQFGMQAPGSLQSLLVAQPAPEPHTIVTALLGVCAACCRRSLRP